MKKIFGVIGLGKFGFHVVKTLAEAKVDVIAIDKDPDRVRQVEEFVTHAYVADALDEKALEESGIFTADTVIVSIGQNIEASILVTVLLLNRGVKDIIAKAINPLHGEVLNRLGVKRVVYPEMETAVKLARSLIITGMVAEIPFAPGYSIFEIRAPERLTGKSLAELDLRKKHGITVLAIKRGDKVLVNPSAKDVIEDKDLLLVLGSEESVHSIVE
ncbi:trk system potassium uptake protein TrkA [Hydrogenivirga caldilitoris]|uniref:Trk system potassium uptake protein TrkA n=1 Tax=Hydrogenivirga caldilitoris TaxID=246264 RepID=A0A497XQU3_9AQUI|nr:TrkA family potassium uptake protein [Hydrogenivirga caldilitoris]RLJ70651.1 trk system potassium uptake protein TrkA [Hydrogenivirga caldilitoris]